MAQTPQSVESRMEPVVGGLIQPLVRNNRSNLHKEVGSPFQVHLEAKLAKFYLYDSSSNLDGNVPQTYLDSEQNYTVRMRRIRPRGRPRKNLSRYENTFKVTFGLDFVNTRQHARKNVLFADWTRENNSKDMFTVFPLSDCFTESNYSRTDQIWSSLWNTSQQGGGAGTAELSFSFNFASDDFKLLDSSSTSQSSTTTPLRLVFESYKYDSVTHDWTEQVERKCCVIKVFNNHGAARRHIVDGQLITTFDYSTASQYVPLPRSVSKKVAKFWSFPDDDQNDEEDQSEPEEVEYMEILVDVPISANIEDDDDLTVIEEEEDQVVPQNDNGHEEEQEVPMEIEQNNENSDFDKENRGIEDNTQVSNCDWLNISTSIKNRSYQDMPEPNVPLAVLNPPPVPLPPSTSTLNPSLNNQQQQVESPNRFQKLSPGIEEFNLSVIQSRTNGDQMPTVQPGTSILNQITNQTSLNNQQQQEKVKPPSTILPESAAMLPITSTSYHSIESFPAYDVLDQSAIQSRTYGDQMSTDQPATSSQFQIINQTSLNQYHQQQVKSPSRSQESSQAINELDISAIQPLASDKMSTIQSSRLNQIQIINQTSFNHHQQQQQVGSPKAVTLPITSTSYHSEESSPVIKELNKSTIQPRTSDHIPTGQPGTLNQKHVTNQTFLSNQEQKKVESTKVTKSRTSDHQMSTVQPGTSNQNYQITNQTSTNLYQQQLQYVSQVHEQALKNFKTSGQFVVNRNPAQSDQQTEQSNPYDLPNPFLNHQSSSNRMPPGAVLNLLIKQEPIDENETLTSKVQQIRKQQQSVHNVVVKNEPSDEQTVPLAPQPPPTLNQVEQQPNDQVKVIYLTITETLNTYPVYIRAQEDFNAAVQLALAPEFRELIVREVCVIGQIENGESDFISVNLEVLNFIENESTFYAKVSNEDGVVYIAFQADIAQLNNAQQD